MEDAIKIVGIFASLFALYKIVTDVFLAKSSKHREEYPFSKEFLKDLKNDDIHNFILEKGFLALTGKSYSIPEVKFLLSLSSPSEAIKLRSSVDKFIEFNKPKALYSWKGAYKKAFIRRFAPLWFMSVYVVIAFFALAPTYIKGIDIFNEFSLVAFSVSFGVVAIASLISHENFKDAKNFMLNIEYHNSNKRASKVDMDLIAKSNTQTVTVSSNIPKSDSLADVREP